MEEEPSPVDLDEVEAELRRRVAGRRSRGDYPEGLAASLDAQFSALVAQREDADWPAGAVEERLAALEDAGRFARDRIELGDGPSARRTVHRLAALLVTRQVEGILTQARAHAAAVRATLTTQWAAMRSLEARQSSVEQRLESALDKLARYERGDGPPGVLARELQEGVREIRQWRLATSFPRPFPEDAFSDAFGGPTEKARRSSAELVARFDAGPVLDIGFGRGDSLALLAARGFDVEGIENDEALVQRAVTAGLPARHADGLAVLAEQDDAVLGGVLVESLEHLGTGQVLDLVVEAARALRPGGRLVVDAVNPASVYAMARSWYLDPRRVRPVDSRFLVFLCRRAGFPAAEIEWRSPVPAEERLAGPGDDTDRLNRLLFADQGYAVIATR